MTDFHLTRRDVLGSGAALSVLQGNAAVAQTGKPSPAKLDTASRTRTAIVTFKVNGQQQRLDLDPRTTLLDALREHLGLMGTKKGCDHGQCGACTVLVNGVRRNACMNLAVARDGDEIVTIEGLGNGEHLHPMQAAFVRHDGFQCGFCTPGQICSAVGMLAELRRGVPSAVTPNLASSAMLAEETEIRERMSGNVCRCAAYPNIVAAIRDAAGTAGG